MGTVYAAYDPTLDRKVAVKVLPGRLGFADEHLLSEAKALAKLAHPNVVNVFDVNHHGDELAISMELIDGQNLRDWLADKKHGWREILQTVRGGGEGVACAHAAGIVHGDIKPENILVGDDGRPRIVDFGLARIDDEDGQSRGGTPGYMAPELLQGASASPFSDQFAFCVTLFESLVDKRPFGSATIADLSRTLEEPGRKPGAPKGAKLPAWLRKVLLRGLSPKAEDRYPDMKSLLRALDRGLARRRHLVLGSGILAIVVVAAGAGYLGSDRAASATSAALACAAGDAKISEIWNPGRQGTVKEAFAKVEPARGPALAERLAISATHYADDWAKGYRETCEATHVRREQSERLLDARMMCLMRASYHFDALVQVWSDSPTLDTLRNADRAISLLPSVTECVRTESLALLASVPDSPHKLEELQNIDRQLARASALLIDDRPGLAKPLLEEVTVRAREAGYDPLLASALLYAAMLHPKDSDKFLRESIVLASGSGDVVTAADAALELLYRAREAGRDEFDTIDPLVRAVVSTAGSDRIWERYHSELGSMFMQRGERTKSLEHFKTSLNFARKLGRPRDIVVALANRAKTEPDSALRLRYSKESEALCIEQLGEEDPLCGYAFIGYARTLEQLGRFSPAIDAARRAVETVDQAIGAEPLDRINYRLELAQIQNRDGRHSDALVTLRELDDASLTLETRSHLLRARASAYLGLGQSDAARTALQESVAIEIKRYGSDTPTTAYINNSIGNTYLEEGSYKAAEAMYRLAYDIWLSLDDGKHPDQAIPLCNMGRAAVAQKEWTRALSFCERALVIDEANLGTDHPDVAYTLTCLGQAQLGLGKRQVALGVLERAEALRASTKGDSESKFALAQALRANGQEPERAQKLAQDALALLATKKQLNKPDDTLREEIEQWLLRP